VTPSDAPSAKSTVQAAIATGMVLDVVYNRNF
jgi:hypothetical protein